MDEKEARELGDGPDDQMSRLCDALMEFLSTHPEAKPSYRYILCIDEDTPEQHNGAFGASGYDDRGEIIRALIEHADSLVKISGGVGIRLMDARELN